MSIFSCVLLAELAVGRIMRARNPSSTGLELALLAREPGRSLDDWLWGDPRGVCLRTLEAVGVDERALVPFFKVDGLRDAVEIVVVVPFDLADWVGAVAAAGRRAVLVGDLVAGLLVVVAEAREAVIVLVASRAGVAEGRLGREGALVAVFRDVRLVLDAALLVGSLEVGGLVARVAGLADDVSVRALVNDLAGDDLATVD